MFPHFSCMFVHVVGLWGLRWRRNPIVEIFAIGMVKLGPTRWTVLVSVEDGLPGFLDELDNPVGVGGVRVVAFVPHGGRRWCSILPDVLIQVATVWVIFRVESLSCSFGFVVADLLSNVISQAVAHLFSIQNILG